MASEGRIKIKTINVVKNRNGSEEFDLCNLLDCPAHSDTSQSFCTCIIRNVGAKAITGRSSMTNLYLFIYLSYQRILSKGINDANTDRRVTTAILAFGFIIGHSEPVPIGVSVPGVTVRPKIGQDSGIQTGCRKNNPWLQSMQQEAC